MRFVLAAAAVVACVLGGAWCFLVADYLASRRAPRPDRLVRRLWASRALWRETK